MPRRKPERPPRKSNRRANKRDNQTRHAYQRAYQRLGVDATAQDIEQMVTDIQTGKAQSLQRQSLRVTMWRVECHGQPCVAIYDSKRKSIASVLTVEMHEADNTTVSDSLPGDNESD